MTTLAYIRETYRVNAFRGGKVMVAEHEGVITGANNGHVLIRLDGETQARPYHPTDFRILYAPKPVEKTPKLDGLGNPIDPAASYYVQDKRTFVGNCVSWWRPHSAGYACDIDDAGTYSGESVLSMRDTDIPWPVEVVLRNTARYVDFQRLSREREMAEVARG